MRLPPAALQAITGPWAIHPTALEMLAPLLAAAVTDPEAAAPIFAAKPSTALARGAAAGESVAVISLHGPIINRIGGFWAELFGVVDPQEFAAQVRMAAADPSVREIILSIDSPGGTVAGTHAAAEAVRAAAQVKPVTAIAEGAVASAAYWIASQATSLTVDPTTAVGSIGVIGTHVDLTAAAEKAGVKVTYVRSVPGKALGQPYEPLSDSARADWQAEIDALHQQFVTAVETGRGTPLPEAAKTGGVLIGHDAVAAGLADHVGTLASVVTGALRGTTSGASASGRSTEVDREALTAALGLEATATDEDILAAVAALTESNTRLAEEVTNLHAETRALQVDAQLTAADLPRVSEESDAAFRRRCVEAATDAESLDAAAEAVAALISERRELIEAGGATPERKAPPVGNTSRQSSGTAREVSDMRATLALN